jgi:hypothetical protein
MATQPHFLTVSFSDPRSGPTSAGRSNAAGRPTAFYRTDAADLAKDLLAFFQKEYETPPPGAAGPVFGMEAGRELSRVDALRFAEDVEKTKDEWERAWSCTDGPRWPEGRRGFLARLYDRAERLERLAREAGAASGSRAAHADEVIALCDELLALGRDTKTSGAAPPVGDYQHMSGPSGLMGRMGTARNEEWDALASEFDRRAERLARLVGVLDPTFDTRAFYSPDVVSVWDAYPAARAALSEENRQRERQELVSSGMNEAVADTYLATQRAIGEDRLRKVMWTKMQWPGYVREVTARRGKWRLFYTTPVLVRAFDDRFTRLKLWAEERRAEGEGTERAAKAVADTRVVTGSASEGMSASPPEPSGVSVICPGLGELAARLRHAGGLPRPKEVITEPTKPLYDYMPALYVHPVVVGEAPPDGPTLNHPAEQWHPPSEPPADAYPAEYIPPAEEILGPHRYFAPLSITIQHEHLVRGIRSGGIVVVAFADPVSVEGTPSETSPAYTMLAVEDLLPCVRKPGWPVGFYYRHQIPPDTRLAPAAGAAWASALLPHMAVPLEVSIRAHPSVAQAAFQMASHGLYLTAEEDWNAAAVRRVLRPIIEPVIVNPVGDWLGVSIKIEKGAILLLPRCRDVEADAEVIRRLATDLWGPLQAWLRQERAEGFAKVSGPLAAQGGAPGDTGRGAKKPARVKREVANALILDHLKRKPHDTVAEVADAVKCSEGLVAESPAWRVTRERLKTARREGKDPKAVKLDLKAVNLAGGTKDSQVHRQREEQETRDVEVDARERELFRRIGEYQKANPTKSAHEVASALKCTAGDVERRQAMIDRLKAEQQKNAREDVNEPDLGTKRGRRRKWVRKQV